VKIIFNKVFLSVNSFSGRKIIFGRVKNGLISDVLFNLVLKILAVVVIKIKVLGSGRF
jgi:hypothetical protein